MMDTNSTGQPGLDSQLVAKAIAALIKHHEESTNKSSLLGNDEHVEVQFTLARVPEKGSPRPYRVQIPHPLHKVLDEGESDQGLDEVEVCLFVKDESKEWVKDLIEKFPRDMGYIKKVLTLTSLRKKYSQYKDRRELLKRYDIFLADDRILPMLGKSIGKSFFKEKKQPVPIKLTRKEALPLTIKTCLRSTFMWISPGTCISIKAGNTGMPPEHLIANAEAIIENAVTRIPRKWSNVSAINIKTSQSVALPVYNKTRKELEEISKLAQLNNKSETMQSSTEQGQDNFDDKEQSGSDKGIKKDKSKETPLSKALKKALTTDRDHRTEAKRPRPNEHELNDNDTEQVQKKKKLGKGTSSKSSAAAISTKSHDISKVGDDNGSTTTADATKIKKKGLDNKLHEKNSSKVNDRTDFVKITASNKSKKDPNVSVQGNEVNTTSSVKKKERTKEKENEVSSKKNKQVETSKQFISSKKFQGSKLGYVFRMGKEGLGYYKDVKPVPDKMALAALARMNKGGAEKGHNVGSNRKTKNRKGRR